MAIFQLTGQTLRTARGGLISTSTSPASVVIGLSGQEATVVQGVIAPEVQWPLVGQALMVPRGGPISRSSAPADVAITLSGQVATVSGGTITPNVNPGNSTDTLLPVPIVKFALTTTATADPVRTGPWTYNKTFISFEGGLRGVGEVAQESFSTRNYYARARGGYLSGYNISQTERLLGVDWSSTLTESFDYKNHGDNGLSTFQTTLGGGPYYLNSPTSFQYDVPELGASNGSVGGVYSIGLDGTFHSVFARVFQSSGATYYAYSNSLQPGAQAIVINPTSPQGLAGVYAHDAFNAYVFYGKTGLAYRRWNGTSFGSEVIIGTSIPAIGTLTVVRSGYGNTIYLVYKDASNFKLTVIVFDAVTETVTSNTLTGTLSGLSMISPGTAPWAMQDSTAYPHRPLAEVAALSSGTSVTQFTIATGIIHLSWTSGTATTPTITIKTAPSNAYDGYAPGWETLEVRGDTVQHILYDIQIRNSDTETAAHITTNDATGTGSSWSTKLEIFHFGDGTTRMPPSSEFNMGNLWLSGFGGGGQTYLFHIPLDQTNASSPNRAGKAWVDFWGGFTTWATGRVGQVTVTIQNAIVVQLTGQAATASGGTLTPNIQYKLTGQAATVSGGSVTGVVSYGWALVGQSCTVSQGAFQPLLQGQIATIVEGTITPAISYQLTGQVATIAQGVVQPTKFVALVGQQVTTSGGAITPLILVPLLGQPANSSGGLFVVASGVTLSGLSSTVTPGLIAPVTAFVLTGKSAQMFSGTLAYLLGATLLGRQAQSQQGVLGIAFTPNLIGQFCTVVQGVQGFKYDCNLFPLGVQALCQVGVFPTRTNAPLVRVENLLWVHQEVEQIFVRVDDGSTFNTTEPME